MGNTHKKLTSSDNSTSSLGPNKDYDWNYTRDRGPTTWWVYYPAAGGLLQSPIDIDPLETEFDSDLSANLLRFAYGDSYSTRMINTGHTVRVDFRPGLAISGGPLENVYRLHHLHFHWGMRNDCGSEHLINGKAFSGEVHLVHWNTQIYSSYEEAVEGKKGLVVLAAFLQIGSHTSEGLQQIMSLLPNVKNKDSFVPISLHPRSLLPVDRSKYWTYEGSLTTPPCHESVTWVVFEDTLSIHKDQVEEFRKLMTHRTDEPCPVNEFDGHMLQTYRPVQPRGSRVVRSVQHNFTTLEDFDQMFHKEGLFTESMEMECQHNRQRLVRNIVPIRAFGHFQTRYKALYGVPQ